MYLRNVWLAASLLAGCVWGGCRQSTAPPEGHVEPPRLIAPDTHGNAVLDFPLPRVASDDVAPKVEGASSVLGPAPRRVAEPVIPASPLSPEDFVSNLRQAHRDRNTAWLARLVFSTRDLPHLDEKVLEEVKRDYLEGSRIDFWERVFAAIQQQGLAGKREGQVLSVPLDLGGALGKVEFRFQEELDGSWRLLRN